ncbi:Dephospho-CoA kinase, putative [Entamoeba invadens IP1]|uniref:Dephospho-CoA kinase, putative n=1 Tax=Entamoeba invadens IP1 TaxID=370355 RepID=A0A0A1UGG0_ENTIV|nr:Dephospho-CoA kinase, putative [Entamoeba invadens IP1]ELP94869.1 Dephospho-CoA kinase, putative [Entamoeba invadens IP1]|eukprot:XP_004261640.1 Dephospho-CoA kinase, putative [Entamoeba invadens IP1]
MEKPYIVGVCGTITSRKSGLCRVMNEFGIITIDCDTIGHDILQNEEVKTKVLALFGDTILDDSKTEIDRTKLADIVFSSQSKLSQLNKVTWDKIEEIVLSKIEIERMKGTKIVGIEAALLIKTNWAKWMDEVWVTVVSPKIALDKLTYGRGLTLPQAKSRLKSQPKSSEYVRFADVLFDSRHNKRTMTRIFREEVKCLVDRVHRKI